MHLLVNINVVSTVNHSKQETPLALEGRSCFRKLYQKGIDTTVMPPVRAPGEIEAFPIEETV